MNLYGYVGGMPTRFVDPFGLVEGWERDPITGGLRPIGEQNPPWGTIIGGLGDQLFPELDPIIDDLKDDPGVIGIGIGAGAGLILGGGLEGITGLEGLPTLGVPFKFPIYDGGLAGGQLGVGGTGEIDLGSGHYGGGIDIDFSRKLGPCDELNIGGGIDIDPEGKPRFRVGIEILR